MTIGPEHRLGEQPPEVPRQFTDREQLITGRERLRWEEMKEDWRNYKHQHLVGGLAESDARRFLASCGITEEALQEVITEGSKGVPLYLDLSVDTYLEIKATQQRDPAHSDFRGTPQDVFERFLRYLDRTETETLKVLSVARFWDRELFELLIREFNTGYPTTALPELRRFSFVQEEQTPGTWTIHPLMRKALQEHLDAELRGRVHRHLFDHYNDSLEGLESRAVSDVHKVALTEAFHHGRYALATEELFEWFTTAEKVLRRAALWQFMIPLYEEFAWLIEDRRGPEHPDTVVTLNNLAQLYHDQGRYEEAEPLLQRTLGIREKTLGPEHLDTVVSISNLGGLYRDQGRYEEAEPLLQRTLGIREKVLGPEHPNTALTLNNLGGLYDEQRRYEDAEPLYKRALEIREEVLGPEHPDTAQSINNLGALYLGQGRFDEAEPLLERALEITEKVFGPEHPSTAITLNNLAGLYYAQGRFEEAERLTR
jgi:tetratricopeptide (TPR) repeat protein